MKTISLLPSAGNLPAGSPRSGPGRPPGPPGLPVWSGPDPLQPRLRGQEEGHERCLHSPAGPHRRPEHWEGRLRHPAGRQGREHGGWFCHRELTLTESLPQVSVRSGGHSYTCTNIKEGGLHIDMRNFNKMEMVRTSQSDTGLALKLGPGNIWGDVLDFAPPTRYSYPHGQSYVPFLSSVISILQGSVAVWVLVVTCLAEESTGSAATTSTATERSTCWPWGWFSLPGRLGWWTARPPA